MAQLTATELEKVGTELFITLCTLTASYDVLQNIGERDEAMQSLLSHVQSLQDEMQQLSGLFQQHGNSQPLISDLVGDTFTVQ